MIPSFSIFARTNLGDDKSIQKIIFLALRNAAKKWTMPLKDWPLALNQFEILCGDFKYDLLENKK